MNASAEIVPNPSRDWWRGPRYAVRVPLLLLHMLVGLPLALLFINPLSARIGVGGERFDYRVVRWWSSALLRIFGFRIVSRGTPLPGAVLFVANHVSWLDINLLHSRCMMCFVAKSEIERWPLIGWMARRVGTIYHRRGSTESLASVSRVMVERLRQGAAVGVFPEGGTGSGDVVRTFHARIFQAAVDADVVAQPVALRYGREGSHDAGVAFAKGESFVANFFRVLGEQRRVAELQFLEPVPINGGGRRKMAETARARIAAALGHETP